MFDPSPTDKQEPFGHTTPLLSSRDSIRRALMILDGKENLWDTDMLEPDEYGEVADAILAVLPEPADRAAVLREAADAVDNTEFPSEHVDLFDNGARWASMLLRELADEAAVGVQPPTPRIRCAHNDVLYGQCIRYLDDHDGDCQHEQQPAVPAAPEEQVR